MKDRIVERAEHVYMYVNNEKPLVKVFSSRFPLRERLGLAVGTLLGADVVYKDPVVILAPTFDKKVFRMFRGRERDGA